MWVLQLETGTDDYTTVDRFATAGCRDDAHEALFDAMERLDRLLDTCEEGHIGHDRMVEALEDRNPGVRPQ